jgi:hypothetical protein
MTAERTSLIWRLACGGPIFLRTQEPRATMGSAQGSGLLLAQEHVIQVVDLNAG